MDREFLEAIATEFKLSAEQREAFLARFDPENLSVGEAKLADKLKIGASSLKKRLTEVYRKLEPLCPELASTKRGKVEALRAALLRRFEQGRLDGDADLEPKLPVRQEDRLKPGAPMPRVRLPENFVARPDQPKGYIWVEPQLERARLQLAKGQARLDFFDGAEATWLDMVAGHDVMRDVQPAILEIVQQWTDRGDRITMVMIQGRSGDGKSTVLRRVATELVGQDYAVLWHRGQASLNGEGLESLAEDQDLIVCVDDLTRILPEELERTLRDLQCVSARVFWVVAVRDDLWGGMDLTLRQVVKLFEFSLRQLSDREISVLLDRLHDYDALGMLTGLGRGEQEQRLRERADRQLLVALLEAKYNENLREYVLRNLYELEQRFGKVVADACKLSCAVQRFGLELPIDYMQEILGVLSPRSDIFSKTEGFLYLPSSINGHDGVHVRHGVIASIIFKNDPSGYERLSQFVEVDRRFSRKWERLTPMLCQTIRLQMRSRQLDLEQVRQVFKAASEDVDIRKYVLNIWALMEREQGNIEKARSLFEKGTQADPKHAPSWQAWALIERE